MPNSAVVVFPVIVVDGDLFEVYYEGKVKTEPTRHVRFHWRGAPSWRSPATVDVVSAEHLEEFVPRRRDDVRELINRMMRPSDLLTECFKTGSLDPLKEAPTDRDAFPFPPLLSEVVKPPKGIRQVLSPF
jgi:hypothetical protein